MKIHVLQNHARSKRRMPFIVVNLDTDRPVIRKGVLEMNIDLAFQYNTVFAQQIQDAFRTLYREDC